MIYISLYKTMEKQGEVITYRSETAPHTLKELSHQIRFAWKWYQWYVLLRRNDAELVQFFKIILEFVMGLWSSKATHSKRLPIYIFTGGG